MTSDEKEDWAKELQRIASKIDELFSDLTDVDILPALKGEDSYRGDPYIAAWPTHLSGFLLLTALSHRSLHRRAGHVLPLVYSLHQAMNGEVLRHVG